MFSSPCFWPTFPVKIYASDMEDILWSFCGGFSSRDCGEMFQQTLV